MDNQQNFINLAEQRHSCRRYSDVQVSDELVQQLIKVARLAPASKGKDSSQYVVVENREQLLQLSQCKSFGASFVKHASHAIVVIGQPEISDVWIENASIAATFIMMQAESLGLGACWVQIREREDAEVKVKSLLKLPSASRVLCIIALGNRC